MCVNGTCECSLGWSSSSDLVSHDGRNCATHLSTIQSIWVVPLILGALCILAAIYKMRHSWIAAADRIMRRRHHKRTFAFATQSNAVATPAASAASAIPAVGGPMTRQVSLPPQPLTLTVAVSSGNSIASSNNNTGTAAVAGGGRGNTTMISPASYIERKLTPLQGSEAAYLVDRGVMLPSTPTASGLVTSPSPAAITLPNSTLTIAVITSPTAAAAAVTAIGGVGDREMNEASRISAGDGLTPSMMIVKIPCSQRLRILITMLSFRLAICLMIAGFCMILMSTIRIREPEHIAGHYWDMSFLLSLVMLSFFTFATDFCIQWMQVTTNLLHIFSSATTT
jgi:hypothetical protein